MPAHSLVNGKPCDSVSLQDRGFNYGDGLFDTMLVCHGQPQFYQQHLRRLQAGCQRLALPLQLAELEADFRQLFQSAEPFARACVKAVITRGVGERGYAASPRPCLSRVLTVTELSVQTVVPAPLKLTVCETRLGRNVQLAGLKHLCRLENVLARSEWSSGRIDEGLLLDSSGLLIEGTSSNVFWACGDTVYTPRLDRCGVEGVVRQVIIEQLAPQLGLTVKQGDYSLDDLYLSDEVFMTSSLMGVRSVASIGCHHKLPGPVAMKLQQQLELVHD